MSQEKFIEKTASFCSPYFKSPTTNKTAERTEIDSDYFNICRTFVLGKEKISYSIGTLGEKTVHSVLKHYLSVGLSNQEIKIGPYYADIVRDGHIYEIQTRNFNKLRKKLDFFLKDYPVTVVYPMAHSTYLRWVSPETGQTTPSRKSPRTGNLLHIFDELYQIRPYLSHPNFSLKIIQMDIEEYRMLDGGNKDKKKGGTKGDRIPISLYAEYDFKTPADYSIFLPKVLPSSFTSKDFRKAANIPLGLADTALLLLTELGVLMRTDKKGNAYIYECVSF